MVGFSPGDLGTGRFDEKLGDSWENQESWQVCVHVIITCRELLDLCCPQYYSCDLDYIFVLQLTFWSTLCLLNCKIVSFSCTYIINVVNTIHMSASLSPLAVSVLVLMMKSGSNSEVNALQSTCSKNQTNKFISRVCYILVMTLLLIFK